MNLDDWRTDVNKHNEIMRTLVDDRLKIKEWMIDYLKQFFKFDEIQFTDCFEKIILKWSYEHNPMMNPKDLEDLGMSFVINHDYSDTLGHGVIIELYPFGYVDEE